MNIFEFADVIDKVLVIRRYPNQKGRYSAHFENCETAEGIVLRYEHGDGMTPQEAIMAYVRAIRGKRLVFHASSKVLRQEFTAPEIFA
jgi:hypothetical protein